MLRKILSLLLVAVVVFTFSCTKDKDEGPSVEENKETLQNLGETLGANIEKMQESEGMNAMTSLMNLMMMDDIFGFFSGYDYGYKSKTVKKVYEIVPSEIAPLLAPKDEPMGFNDITGTYTWNADIQRWSIDAGNPANAVVIVFPTEETPAREATLTISDYQEVTISDEWDSWTQPTKIMANMKIDGSQVMDLSFNAAFDNNGDPTSLSVAFNATPMSMSLGFSDNGSKMNADASMKMDGQTLMGVDLAISYTTITDEWGDEEMMPSLIDGYVLYGPIKVEGDLDIAAIEELYESGAYTDQNSYVAGMNSNMNIALYNSDGGSKIADVEFYVPADPEALPIQLVFTDGSEEPVEIYLAAIMASVQQTLEEMGIDINDLDSFYY